MLADRIAALEGILADVVHGRIPNFYAERGGCAEWRFNRTSFVIRTLLKLVIWTSIALGFVLWMRSRRACVLGLKA
ncbi:MAG: hypothetical protein QM790_11265 [Nibricoccus sp.]